MKPLDVATIDWLVGGDPSIGWQALRDLTDAAPEKIAVERARIPREGFGANILAIQDADGAWRRDGRPAWLSTLFTLMFLRATGADPSSPEIAAAIERLASSLGFEGRSGPWDLRPIASGATPFFDGEEEPCINGGVLALSGYFGQPSHRLARLLAGEQLGDGGWNCEAPQSTHASYHTTMCVLEGLLEYERAVGGAPEIAIARRRGEEYLLERDLFRRRSTGDVANPAFVELAFPPRYHYDILRALDYFRAAGAAPDPRMRDAIELVERKRHADGRWLLDRAYDEALPVRFGESVHEASGWNTLRALRVLRWYETRV